MLYSSSSLAAILGASKAVPMGDETANRQRQSDYRESYGYGLGDFVVVEL